MNGENTYSSLIRNYVNLGEKQSKDDLFTHFANLQDITNILEDLDRIEKEQELQLKELIEMPANSLEEPVQKSENFLTNQANLMFRYATSQSKSPKQNLSTFANIAPLKIKEQNYNLAMEIYTNLHNALNQMELFDNAFQSSIKPPVGLRSYQVDEGKLNGAVKDHLNEILHLHQYFQANANSHAKKIFKNRFKQTKDTIIAFFRQPYATYYQFTPIFEVFYCHENQHSKTILENIMIKSLQIDLNQMNQSIELGSFDLKSTQRFFENFFQLYKQVQETINSKFCDKPPDSVRNTINDLFARSFSVRINLVIQNSNQYNENEHYFTEIYQNLQNHIPEINRINQASMIASIKSKVYLEFEKSIWTPAIQELIKDMHNKYIITSPFEIPSISIDLSKDRKDPLTKYENGLIIQECANLVKFVKYDMLNKMNLYEIDDSTYQNKMFKFSCSIINRIIDELNQVKIEAFDGSNQILACITLINSYNALHLTKSYFTDLDIEKAEPIKKLNGFKCPISSPQNFIKYFIPQIDESTALIKNHLVGEKSQEILLLQMARVIMHQIIDDLVSNKDSQKKIKFKTIIEPYTVLFERSGKAKELSNKFGSFLRSPSDSTMTAITNEYTDDKSEMDYLLQRLPYFLQ